MPREPNQKTSGGARAVLRFTARFHNAIPVYIVLIVTLVLYATQFYPSIDRDIQSAVTPFNLNWTRVGYGGETRSIGPLPQKLEISNGETVRLFNYLPQKLEEQTVLCLRSSRQKIRVWVSGKEIAAYGNIQPYPFENLPSNAFIFAHLPADAAGKRIDISVSSSFLPHSGKINHMFLGSMSSCIIEIHYIFRGKIIFSTFMFVFGLMVMLVFYITGKRHRYYDNIKYLGLLILTSTLWFISTTNILQVYIGNHYAVLALDAFLFLMLPFPYLFFVRSSIENLLSKSIIDLIIAIFVLNAGLQVVIHLLGIASISSYYWVTTLLLGLSIFITIGLILFSITDDEQYNLIPVFLFSLSLIVCYIIELFFYYGFVLRYEFFGTTIQTGLLIYSLGTCAFAVFHTMADLEKSDSIREELQQKQIALALSQIQPHFLYNSLAAIHTLISADPEKASTMVYNFSKYLRTNLNNMESKEFIPFAEEVRNIRVYTDIEQVRFPKIEIVFQIESDGFYVPVLTIQPLAENAIRHGISKKREGGRLLIRSYEDFESFYVEVTDNGVGICADKVDVRFGVGLRNISYRLETMAHASLDIKSEEGTGTTALVTFPKSFTRSEFYENHSG